MNPQLKPPQQSEKDNNKSMSSRFINAVSWRMGSNLFQIFFQLTQTIILLRLLSVEAFGVFGYTKAIVLMTLPIARFGLGPAFIHRDPETEDEQFAISIFFSLNTMFITIWMIIMIAVAFLFFELSVYRWSLLTFALAQYLIQMCYAPRLIFNRRVNHQQLSIIDTIIASSTSVIAIILAFLGFDLRTLLVVELIRGLLFVALHYMYRPIWRPKFGWKPSTVRYYLNFGFKSFAASGLLPAIDRFDDYWVGQYLGVTPLGFYTRAYALARYPKILLSTAVDNVIFGAYAELKDNRPSLSAAFFRASAFLTRFGFLIAGLMMVMAEEAILLVGEQWLPMVPIFRIMLLFVLLDPLQKTIFSLYHAMGQPELLIRLRIAQFVLLVVLLFTLGNLYGTVGVAIGVDLVIFIGVAYGLYRIRDFVDFSMTKLFAWPLILCTFGIALVLFLDNLQLLFNSLSLWIQIFVKGSIFTAVYSLLILIEFQKIQKYWQLIVSKRFAKIG